MSLVNQMLQDLERRQAGGVVAANGEVLSELSASGVPPERVDGFRGVSGLMLVLLIVVLAALVWRGPPLEIAWPWQQALVSVSPVAEKLPAAAPVPRPAVTQPVVPVAADIDPFPMSVSPAPPRQHRLRLAHSLTRTPKPATPIAAVKALPVVVAKGVLKPVRIAVETSQNKAPLENRTKLSAVKQNAGPPPSEQRPTVKAITLTKTPVPFSPQERAEQEFFKAKELLRVGATERGEVGLRTALTLDSRHIDARELLVARLAHRGDFSGAEKLLAAGLQEVPGEPRFAGMWARMLVEQGNLARALNILKLASPPVAGNETYHALHAAVLQRAGHHQEVVGLYRALLLSQPSSGTWWMGLGLSLEALGERAEARHAYTKAQGSGSLRGKVLQFVEQKLAATR